MKSTHDKWKGFYASLQGPFPPEDLSVSLKALWLVKNGRWEEAHDLVNDLETDEAMHVHAHLHRVEGDTGNAAYWYRKAGEPVFRGSTESEWELIVLRQLHTETDTQSGPVS